MRLLPLPAAGLKSFGLQSGTKIDSKLLVVVDGGTEYQGDFKAYLTGLGIRMQESTAYKHNTNQSGVWENVNQQIQMRTRNSMYLSTGNFRLMFGPLSHKKVLLPGLDYLPYAYTHAAFQIRTQNRLAALEDNNEITPSAKLAELRRLLPVPWGCLCTLTNQAGQTSLRGRAVKQLQPRGTNCIFLGTEVGTGRYILLTSSNRVVKSSDVGFDIATCCEPVPEGATGLLHDIWLGFGIVETEA